MAKEIKSLLLAVLVTIGVYLYITNAGPATQTAQFAGQLEAVDAPPQVTLVVGAETSFGTPELNEVQRGPENAMHFLGNTVKLIDVAATGSSVVLEINGARHVVAHYGVIDGLKIYVIETFYSKDPAERSATLVIAKV